MIPIGNLMVGDTIAFTLRGDGISAEGKVRSGQVTAIGQKVIGISGEMIFRDSVFLIEIIKPGPRSSEQTGPVSPYFCNCVFVGDPPKGHESWGDWVKSLPLKDAKITAIT